MTRDPSLITPGQRGKLMVLCAKLGLNREARMATLNALLWREVPSSNELLKHEASGIIDNLQAVVDSPDPQAALAALVERAANAKAEHGGAA